MSTSKLISGFFCRLILIYGVLIAPWPGLREGYSTAYRAVGNALFGSFGSDGVVRFEPLSDGKPGVDTEIRISNRRTPGRASHFHNTHLRAYLPTAAVVALILATPIPWSRRWKALFWGWMLVNGVVALRMMIVLLFGFSRDHPCALYSPSPFWNDLLVITWKIVDVWIGFAFVASVFIWILATFRRSDFHAWAASWGGGGDAQSRDREGAAAPPSKSRR